MSDDTTSDLRMPTSDSPVSVWRGKRVRLRAIEPTDWEVYSAWNEDDDQARSLYHIPFPQSAEAVRQWALQESTRKPDGDAFRFVIENEQGEVVGNLATHDCDPRVGTFSYGISIRREQRRHGYAAEAIALVLRYYFRSCATRRRPSPSTASTNPPPASTKSWASNWKGASDGPSSPTASIMTR